MSMKKFFVCALMATLLAAVPAFAQKRRLITAFDFAYRQKTITFV